jgi:hypothetical protein
VIVDYLHLWNDLQEVVLQPRVSDRHFWWFASNGQYSAKLAYEGFFCGSVGFEPYERIWKTWAPVKCRFFTWLVAHNRCWTADRLARRGMDHPEHCPLCDHEEEVIDHLMLSCVFAREFWYKVLQKVQLQELAPQPGESSFMEWWQKANERAPEPSKNGLNSMIILGAWTLWKHQNRCVFDGIAPNLVTAVTQDDEERRFWELAGARGISHLIAQLPEA